VPFPTSFVVKNGSNIFSFVFSSGSKKLLDTYIEEGQLVICEIVYAELASQLLSEGAVRDFFADTGIKLINSDEKTLLCHSCESRNPDAVPAKAGSY